MRSIAFGYSTRCNIRCEHCVAVKDSPDKIKMDPGVAKTIISRMAEADVTGISFTAGEPLIYFNEIIDLVSHCYENNIYTRIVTNSFWAKTKEESDRVVFALKESGLSQLRMSYSRWHQKHISHRNILNAATSCKKAGLDYFISFVTDFSQADDPFEQFLRDHNLKFFPEPVIYAGRAKSFEHRELFTDYQANCCPMNPYLSPGLDMFACCDAGSHFTNTNFFYLGNLKDYTVDQLFKKTETNRLYQQIRTVGITQIASFAGFKSRKIVTYRKCELCKKLFDSPEMLKILQNAAETELSQWRR